MSGVLRVVIKQAILYGFGVVANNHPVLLCSSQLVLFQLSKL